MADDFDRSPRGSKRRKVTTAYGSSTHSKNDTSSYSVFRSVSDTVTGLSKRLFVGGDTSKFAEQDDSEYGLKDESFEEDGTNNIGTSGGKAAPQSDSLEIPESEDELATEELVGTPRKRADDYTSSELQLSKVRYRPAGKREPSSKNATRSARRAEMDSHGARTDEATTQSPSLKPILSGQGKRLKAIAYLQASDAEEVTSDENELAKSASTGTSRSSRSLRANRAIGNERRDENSNTRIPDREESGPDTEDAAGDGDITPLQPRASGRDRKRPRRFSIDPLQDVRTEENGIGDQHTTTSSPTEPVATKGKAKEKQLVGILTPSKRNEKRPRKSVAFESSEKRVEDELGFKDISKSKKKSKKTRATPEGSSSVSRMSKLVDEEYIYTSDGDVEMPDALLPDELHSDDLVSDLTLMAQPLVEPSLADGEVATEESPHLLAIKSCILSRLTTRAFPPSLPPHLASSYATIHALLQATVTTGESNSLLLLGARGAGKSLLINTVLTELNSKHASEFHIVKLNGFVQTDDRLALREIWRQLGKEMEVQEEETNQVVGSYADTMTSLLGLLSHPEDLEDTIRADSEGREKTTKSVVFILDEFDLFTTHPRQTLLYNLFDIAQSRKAPIAVLGCSTRMDVVECLEKRVKSRFSHRWIHIAHPKGLKAFEDTLREVLFMDEGAAGMKKEDKIWRVKWNEYIKTVFLPSPPIQSLLTQTFHTTKSLPDLLAALYIPLATADVTPTAGSDPLSIHTVTQTPPSLLNLLPTLPSVHLSLLTSATRLETIHALPATNYNITYAHYTDLLTKSRIQASAQGATASGMRTWGREVGLRAWEELVRWGFLVLAEGGGKEEGGEGRMYRVDVSIEEVKWGVERVGGAVGEGLGRWCREI